MTSVVDGASVEVIRSYLVAAAEEMRATLIRTAFNPVIYEVLDFGISIYDARLRLVAEAAGLTRFLGANDYSLRKGVEYAGVHNLHRGDVVLLNYPYWNAAHAYDATMFMPVFETTSSGSSESSGSSGHVTASGDDEAGQDDGGLFGFVCVRAHWMDLGAKDPGYVLDSTDVHQEGLIFPGTKVFERGEPDEKILELIRFNSRMPDLVIGDLHAQVAALRTGERRLGEVVAKFGRPAVDQAIDRVVEIGTEQAHEALRGLPRGSWTAQDWVDDDGIGDQPVRMQVTVTIDEDRFVCDFTGSDPATRGPINMPLGSTIACARVAFKAFTTPGEQTNAGHFAPLEVVAEPGSLFHAVYPAATFTQWTGNLAVELIYKALSQADPDRVAASSGGDVPGYMMVGEHPDSGELFAISNNDLVGWGATTSHDGHGPANHICQTMGRTTPIEVLETRSGMVVERVEIRCDSGGAGRHRGGPGLVRQIRFRSAGEFLSVVKKTRTRPWALAEGAEPEPHQVVLFPGTDRERRVSTARTKVGPGDRVRIVTAGGGGHGSPRLRDPDLVRRDVDEGYVSVAAAAACYGVEVSSERGR